VSPLRIPTLVAELQEPDNPWQARSGLDQNLVGGSDPRDGLQVSMDTIDEMAAVDLSQHPTNDVPTDEPRSRWILTDTLVPPPGESTRVVVEGRAVAIFNVGGRLYGLASECGHRGAPLEHGSVKEGVVSCSKHGAQFRLDSGAVVGGNMFVRRSTHPVRTYAVQSRGGNVAVGVSPLEEGQ